VQKTSQSSKRLIEKKIEALGVGPKFRVYDDKIETPGDGVIIFQGMQDHTANRSSRWRASTGPGRGGADAQRAQPDAAAPDHPGEAPRSGSAGTRAARPTRSTSSCGPRSRTGAGRGPGQLARQPVVPAVLEDERKLDLELYPDRYDHIWEGGLRQGARGRLLRQAAGEGQG
jgi:phage terminase large subunit